MLGRRYDAAGTSIFYEDWGLTCEARIRLNLEAAGAEKGFLRRGHVKRSQHLTFIALTVHNLHITIVLTDLPISCDFFSFWQ